MKDSFSKLLAPQHSNIRIDDKGLIRKKCKKKEVSVVECILEDWKKTQIKHPNIVGYKQIQEIDNTYEIIMEACDGTLLGLQKEYHEKNCVFTVPILMDFFQQILQGYKYLQSLFALFIHRDFTLDNFLYLKQDEKYIIKICDFGVSKIQKKNEQREKQDSDIKNKQIILSENFKNQKRQYMAPEIKDKNGYNNSVDIFSLGTCLYFLNQGLAQKIGDDYKGYDSNSNNPLFNNSQIKNQFLLLVQRMCSVDQSKRPRWEELYQYIFELPQLYDPLNKRLHLEDFTYLQYFQLTLLQIRPQNLNFSTCMQNQNEITSLSNQETTIIEIDSKVYKLVYKFMPLFLDRKLVKKQFFIILLVFQHKIKRGCQKLLDEYNVTYKYLQRIQSLKYIIKIIMETVSKMMNTNIPSINTIKNCYFKLIYDYTEQIKIIETIQFPSDLRKYFKRYIKSIKRNLS